MTSPRPPLDPDLFEAHSRFPKRSGLDSQDKLDARRKSAALSWGAISRGRYAINHEEVDIPGPAGPLRASILRSKKNVLRPQETVGIVHFHGGGFCTSDRFHGLNTLFDIIETLGVVVIGAEYRLTPEHPQPAPVEDSYAALLWAHSHAAELGFNPDKIVTCGGSAGGNLTAAVSLLCRDRAGPKLLGQLLFYPWLSDETTSTSLDQFGDLQPWTQEDTSHALDLALGKDRSYASIYTLPATTPDLSGLPPTYIDVGEADVFRDQDVDFANRLWKAGIPTEFHVWLGAWHAFDTFAPEAPVSKKAFQARLEWLERLIHDNA
ncbi:alpha/beta hydrolase [Aspergillus undulatus]|uniref:alpha/beta hydrolase n=1 Tax=Aspergillus undulatus TaxID=1810928 RepID=UPI003CCE2168